LESENPLNRRHDPPRRKDYGRRRYDKNPAGLRIEYGDELVDRRVADRERRRNQITVDEYHREQNADE
jgi:hypothetical protein